MALEHEQEIERLRLSGVVPKEKDLHGAAQVRRRGGRVMEGVLR